RRGEVLGLQRHDIVWNSDRTAAILYVRRQKNGSTGKLTDPKSDSGRRSMSVPPLMIERLREHLDQHVGRGRTAPVVPSEARGSQYLSASRWNGIWAGARGAVLLSWFRLYGRGEQKSPERSDWTTRFRPRSDLAVGNQVQNMYDCHSPERSGRVRSSLPWKLNLCPGGRCFCSPLFRRPSLCSGRYLPPERSVA